MKKFLKFLESFALLLYAVVALAYAIRLIYGLVYQQVA